MTIDTEALLDERGKTHGDYAVHAEITQDLKSIMGAYSQPGRLTPSQQESLDMIAHKIGRILAGDPNHVDHWDDIAGYAKLISRQLTKQLLEVTTMSTLEGHVAEQDQITEDWEANGPSLDEATEEWRHFPSIATAHAFMTAVMDYESDGMISTEQLIDSMAEIRDWLKTASSN